MTCRERLANEHPERVNEMFGGGCHGCPYDYNYMRKPDFCDGAGDACRRCWDREIPGTEGDKMKAADTPRILDSGTRREFDSGAVRDVAEGKGRCDLLPLDIIGQFMEDGILEGIGTYIRGGNPEHLWEVIELFVSRFGYHGIVDMLLEVAKHYEEGAKKYAERNWEKGISLHCYIDSGVRHYLKFLRGDKDEPHDRAFVWNMLGAIWTHLHKPELIDLPFKEEKANDGWREN